MQIISALVWPVVALVGIGAVLFIVHSFHAAIVQAMTERPMKLAVGLGKMRATAETLRSDKIVEIEHGKLVEDKPLGREVPKRVEAEQSTPMKTNSPVTP